MTNKQESQFGMLRDASHLIVGNMDRIKDLPELEKNSASLQTNISEIDRITKIQNFDKTGLAREKRQLRDVLMLLTHDNSLKLEAYAKISNNVVLAGETHFTRSKMVKASDTIIYEYAQMIYDKAQENLNSLGAYGITAETQSVLQNTIDSYKLSVAKPRLGQKEKKEATKRLNELFKESDQLLEKIDAVMNIIMQKQPDLYNKYKELRKVVVTGTGSLAMKAVAVEIPSGFPLRGVSFTFYPEGTEMTVQGGSFIKKTAEKGRFYIKRLSEGTYKVKVSKTGYKDKEVKINVVPGEMVELAVAMEKV